MTIKRNIVIATLLLVCLLVSMAPITVQAATKKITLNRSKATLEVGNTVSLKVTSKGLKGVTWKSSNTKIATVSKSGLVVGVSEGETSITASVGTLKAVCKITVTRSTAEGVDLVLLFKGVGYDDASIYKELKSYDYTAGEIIDMFVYGFEYTDIQIFKMLDSCYDSLEDIAYDLYASSYTLDEIQSLFLKVGYSEERVTEIVNLLKGNTLSCH